MSDTWPTLGASRWAIPIICLIVMVLATLLGFFLRKYVARLIAHLRKPKTKVIEEDLVGTSSSVSVSASVHSPPASAQPSATTSESSESSSPQPRRQATVRLSAFGAGF